MPDAAGYDWKRGPHRPLERGDRVYVTDVTHAWEGMFVAYKEDGWAVVATPGGDPTLVNVKDVRRAKVVGSPPS